MTLLQQVAAGVERAVYALTRHSIQFSVYDHAAVWLCVAVEQLPQGWLRLSNTGFQCYDPKDMIVATVQHYLSVQVKEYFMGEFNP